MSYGQVIDSRSALKPERAPDSGFRNRLETALVPTQAQLWGVLGVLACVLIAVILLLL